MRARRATPGSPTIPRPSACTRREQRGASDRGIEHSSARWRLARRSLADDRRRGRDGPGGATTRVAIGGILSAAGARVTVEYAPAALDLHFEGPSTSVDVPGAARAIACPTELGRCYLFSDDHAQRRLAEIRGETPWRDALMRGLLRGLFGVALLTACARSEPAVEAPAAPKVVAASKVGDKVTPFSGKDQMSSATIGFAPGKVNLVWFWATWSIDNKAMPHIAALAKKYESQGLHVVLVSIDDEPKGIPEFLRTYGAAELHTIWDEGHVIANDYFRPPCSPTFYIIDRGGIVRDVFCGFHEGEVELNLEPACKRLL
jgi:hypothetical protein